LWSCGCIPEEYRFAPRGGEFTPSDSKNNRISVAPEPTLVDDGKWSAAGTDVVEFDATLQTVSLYMRMPGFRQPDPLSELRQWVFSCHTIFVKFELIFPQVDNPSINQISPAVAAVKPRSVSRFVA
jgi:hypothetical protein